MSAALKLALVGHTNVGKTSLLRTLTRDIGFGEVSHRPSTTRHVEGARLLVDGESLLELYDTPGLEDAIALLDHLERIERPGERLDGPARTERFLEGSEARQRFEQEAKVLRQLLASDAGLYVIDAREPVLAKYKDELAVLAGCGKPLLPPGHPIDLIPGVLTLAFTTNRGGAFSLFTDAPWFFAIVSVAGLIAFRFSWLPPRKCWSGSHSR